MLFKKIIAVYSENHMKFINTKYNATSEKPGGIYIYR
jgi:hypothetical protein